jgi:hypothetical protein
MWIKVRKELRHNAKVVMVASRIGVTSIHAFGAIVQTWMLADDSADENGFIEHLTFDHLNGIIGIEKLAEAMEEVGWITEVDGGVQFIDYQEHNGTTAKTRAQNQKRQALSRKRQSKKRHASVTIDHDKNISREEKIRLKNIKKKLIELEKEKEAKKKKKKRDLELKIKGWVEDIFQEYPRRVGKAAAVRAINKALKKENYTFLMEKTKAFALDRRGKDPEFTPHPSTWFNREHYHDEPEENKKPEPKLKKLKAGTHDWN